MNKLEFALGSIARVLAAAPATGRNARRAAKPGSCSRVKRRRRAMAGACLLALAAPSQGFAQVERAGSYPAPLPSESAKLLKLVPRCVRPPTIDLHRSATTSPTQADRAADALRRAYVLFPSTVCPKG